MADYKLHVVSHTHWDREWYLTFQQFRMKLVELMDALLTLLDRDPEFKHFSLDGQTILLEDYLAIRPENEERIKRYVREGRLAVGPWYVLNDEHLVSGEATVRSLLIGSRIAGEFGGIMKVGYLPDQFGNISQMPQILRGFDIDNAIFGRGLQLVDGRHMEFLWRAPDGSEVLASLMAWWYNNAQRFPADLNEAVQYTRNLKTLMAPRSHTNHLLLMNGVDHLVAQEDLSGIMHRVNERLADVGGSLVHSSLEAYVDGIKDALAHHTPDVQTVEGELREDRGSSVLAGTLSARMYIKQANHESQVALEKYAEPFCSFAWMLDREYPQGFLTHAWKLLMENHPHDSICGCSIDQVHREMMPRFDQVRQVGDDLTARALEHIAGRINTVADTLVVFNPLNWTRTDRARAVIDFEIGDAVRGNPCIDPARDVPALEIHDPEGNPVPFSVVESIVCIKRHLSPIDLPLSVMVRRFTIELLAENVPPCGYRCYRFFPAASMPRFDESLTSEFYWDNVITNEDLRATMLRSVLTAERVGEGEALGDVYSNLNIFEDVGDVGDEYNHVKPSRDRAVNSLDISTRLSVEDRSPVSASYRVDMELMLPASANAEETARSDELVACPISTWITVIRGVPRIEFVTEVDNRARDHRLRVLFPTGISSDCSHAEAQYDVVTRPVRPPKEWPGASPFFPQQSWVDVNDEDRGLCLINKGLPEFELYDDDARTLALTLLRSVGKLSGSDAAPPAYLTPEAQCLGTHRFEYAIYPHAGSWEDGRCWQQAHQFNVPLISVQTGQHDGDLPEQMSFVEVSTSDLVVTAIKKAEERDELIVRLFNITDHTEEGAGIRVRGARSARLLNLNEGPQQELPMLENGTVTLEVPPKKIVTLGFTLE